MKHIHRHSTGTRDAALRRLTSVNRWLIAGSVALTGVLYEAAAQAFPGKKLNAGAAAKRASRSRAHTPSPSSEEFHPPEQAPQASGESSSESQGSSGDSGEGSAPSGEAPSSESSPPAESSPPSESSPPPEASSESPPVVSGAS